MDPLLGEFSAELQGISPTSPKIGIFSTVHEGNYVRPGGEPIHDVAYWLKGMRHSVYFTHGVRNAVDNGYTTFLELAPNPVALMQIGLTTAAAGLPDAQLIATLARKQDDLEAMTSAMAQLFVLGHGLDIRTLFTRAQGPQDCECSADPLPPQGALAGCALLRRRLGADARYTRGDARRPARVGVRPARRDGSGGSGESRCDTASFRMRC